MTSALAFISHDFQLTENDRTRLVAESGSCSVAFKVEAWSQEPRLPRKDWDKAVHAQVGRCDFMIVLVAQGMEMEHVAEEIVEAKRCNVPFFGVYVGDAKPGAELPAGLPANRTIPWDWKRITAAVGQVNSEGKHHVFA